MEGTVEKDVMVRMAEKLHVFGNGMTLENLVRQGTLACAEYKVKASRCEGCTKLHFQRMHFMLRMSWRSGNTDTVSAWKMAVKVYPREV